MLAATDSRAFNRHAQIKPRRLERETRRRQHLAPLFEDGEVPAAPRHPVRNERPIPEMAPPALMSQAPLRAGQGGQEYGAVGAAEIEGRVVFFAAERADNVPVPPPGRALRGQGKRPGAVHARGETEQFGADGCGQGVELRGRIMPLDFPQGRDKVDGIAQETQVHDDDFARRFGLVVKVCE
jgi:hypothetical protein